MKRLFDAINARLLLFLVDATALVYKHWTVPSVPPPVPCKKISAWSTKTRRPPSRLCRDVRVYGLKTTVIRDKTYQLKKKPRRHRLVSNSPASFCD